MNMAFGSLSSRMTLHSQGPGVSPQPRKEAYNSLRHASPGDRFVLSGAGRNAVRFSGKEEDHAEFRKAAEKGDTAKVREFLARPDIEPNFKNGWGSTALASAVVHKHVETAKVLLDKNADPDVQNEEGVTPLMQGACYGDQELFGVLLEKSKNPLLSDNEGNTALHYATAGDHPNIVRLLLEKTKADPMLKNHVGTSALMLARDNDFAEIKADLKNKIKSEKALSLKKVKSEQPFSQFLKKSACWKSPENTVQE